MKKLLNTLYVTSESSYLALDGENIVVLEDTAEVVRYRGTSPALMGACAERNISLCYMTPQGKFLARVSGKTRGNVVLRQQQYASTNMNCRVLKLQGTAFWEKYTMQDGCWSERFGILAFRLMWNR